MIPFSLYIWSGVISVVTGLILLRPLYVYLGDVERKAEALEGRLTETAAIVRELALRLGDREAAVLDLMGLIEATQESQVLLHDRLRWLEQAWIGEHPDPAVTEIAVRPPTAGEGPNEGAWN